MEKKTEFLELMNVLLSQTMSVKLKKKILEEKFHMNMESRLGEKVNLMCNLSDLVEERGIEKGEYKKLKKQVEKKLLKGLSVEDIADMLEEEIEDIQKIINEIKIAY